MQMPGSPGQDDTSHGKPNVLLIICDDLNNAIEGMGRIPYALAPNVQRLARRGVAFLNAQSNCPICLPSRNSLLSGLYAHTTGHYAIVDDWRASTYVYTTLFPGNKYGGRPLLRDALMLPRYFKDHGYSSFGTGKVHHEGMVDPAWWTDYAHAPDYGPFSLNVTGDAWGPSDNLKLFEGEPLLSYINRYEGIDRLYLDGTKLRFIPNLAFGSLRDVCGKAGFRNQDGSAFRYVDDDDRDLLPDEKSAGWAAEILGRRHAKPFFLAVGFMKPHCPNHVPQKYFDMFSPNELALPPFLEGDLDDCAHAHIENWPGNSINYELVMKGGEALWRKWLRAYLACVAFVDEQLGRILDALDSSPYRDNTIIIFTSDNGYHMGEKEILGKNTLWEESGQIPLIVSAPGVARAGGKCTRPVSLIDIYPTLNDLCGLPNEPHAKTHGHPLDGYSLRPLLEGPARGAWQGPPVALSSVRGHTGIHHSVRSEQYRYVLCQNGEEELYDHEADPHEWRNRAQDSAYQAVKRLLRDELMGLIWKT